MAYRIYMVIMRHISWHHPPGYQSADSPQTHFGYIFNTYIKSTHSGFDSREKCFL